MSSKGKRRMNLISMETQYQPVEYFCCQLLNTPLCLVNCFQRTSHTFHFIRQSKRSIIALAMENISMKGCENLYCVRTRRNVETQLLKSFGHIGGGGVGGVSKSVQFTVCVENSKTNKAHTLHKCNQDSEYNCLLSIYLEPFNPTCLGIKNMFLSSRLQIRAKVKLKLSVAE